MRLLDDTVARLKGLGPWVKYGFEVNEMGDEETRKRGDEEMRR